MSTKNSPLSKLKAEADNIARHLAAFERGEPIDPQFASKLEAARKQEVVKIGIVMDDKIITLEIPWTTIKSSGEVAMSEYILKQMREHRTTLQ